MDAIFKVLLKIFLMWLLFFVTSPQAAIIKDKAKENAASELDKIYVKPSELVMKETSASGRPLIYQFIIDYPHPHVPENTYYKPWNPVSSNPITVANGDYGSHRILKKKNILYLSKSTEDQNDTSQ